MSRISQKQKQEMRNFYANHCMLCLKGRVHTSDVGDVLENAVRAPELHHLRMRSLGGEDSLDNIFLACASHHQGVFHRTSGEKPSFFDRRTPLPALPGSLLEQGPLSSPHDVLEIVYSLLLNHALLDRDQAHLLLFEAEGMRRLGRVNTCLHILNIVDSMGVQCLTDELWEAQMITRAKALASAGDPIGSIGIVEELLRLKQSSERTDWEHFRLLGTHLNSSIQCGLPISGYWNEVSSLLDSLSAKTYGAERGTLLLFEATMHRQGNAYSEAAAVYNQAYRVLSENDPRGAAMALRNEARVRSLLGDHSNSIGLHQSAIDAFLEVGDYWNYSITAFTLADAIIRSYESGLACEDVTEALGWYEKGARWMETRGDRHFLPVVYENMAYLLQLFEDNEGAHTLLSLSRRAREERSLCRMDDITYLESFYGTLRESG
jgi:hypothetical protein